MSTNRGLLLNLLAVPLVSSLTGVPGRCQTLSAPVKPAAVALVQTPEFCATKTKKGTWGINKETFEVGKTACAELEPALRSVFPGLMQVHDEASAGAAEAVLVPKFVNVGATQALGAFSNREMVILLEWTVKDKSGKTLWLETVQGSSKHHMGNAFTYKKNLKLIVHDSVKDAAAQTAVKMSAAKELSKLLGGTSGGAASGK